MTNLRILNPKCSLLLLLFAAQLSGCVAKKKYVMARAKYERLQSDTDRKDRELAVVYAEQAVLSEKLKQAESACTSSSESLRSLNENLEKQYSDLLARYGRMEQTQTMLKGLSQTVVDNQVKTDATIEKVRNQLSTQTRKIELGVGRIDKKISKIGETQVEGQ